MAVNPRGHAAPPRPVPVDAHWPGARLDEVTLAYDAPPIDTLYVSFAGDSQPGYYVPVDLDDPAADGLLVKVSLDDRTVLGAMIEGYLAWADQRGDPWLAVAPFAGAAAKLNDDDRMRFLLTGRDEAVQDLLTELRGAWQAFIGSQRRSVRALR